MTKISQLIEYYESLEPKSAIDRYFVDQKLDRKIADLKTMLEVVGDIEVTEEYIKTFLYGLYSKGFDSDSESMSEMIRLIYALSFDVTLTSDELCDLFVKYHHGLYSLMFDEIKKLLISHKPFRLGLLTITDEAIEYAERECLKIEALKQKYSPEFIGKIQKIIKEELISEERVMAVLPSKEFIDESLVTIMGGRVITSAEDLVIKRLESKRFDEKYQVIPSDERIKIGYCSDGSQVYTSFTKGEYEKDLECQKVLKKQ